MLLESCWLIYGAVTKSATSSGLARRRSRQPSVFFTSGMFALMNAWKYYIIKI
jgi:hypothetical protein